jgi:Nucleoside-diphosphate-sugar epimerases
MNNNVLVTGAAGFIGSFLCEELLAHKFNVIGVDNFFRGKQENIINLISKNNFTLKEYDLSIQNNINVIKKILFENDINMVIHLAAINGTQYFYDRSMFVLDQNIKITQNLLAAINGTAVQHIVYASSSEVYGDPLIIPTNEQHPILLYTTHDRDSYGASKAIGEFYINFLLKSINFLA